MNAAVHSRETGAWKAGLKLRLHPGSGKGVQVPIRREDSSAGLPEDAKFESGREVMIDPAVDAGFGETRGQVTARLEERSFGVTRSFTAGGAGGCRHRGNSETQRRQHRKVRDSRTLGDLPFGAAKGLRIRGNPETHRRRSREMQSSGRPRRLIAGVTGGREIRGNSKIRSKGARKDAGFEETRRPVLGEAGGAKFRGNPEFHRQPSRGRWIRGNWKTHRQVERDEAWSESLASLP